MDLSEKMLSAGRGALFLTALSAGSQLLGFGFRVLLSLTAVGLTSAVSNLPSQHLALGNRRAADQTIAACLKIFFLLLLPVGAAVILGSDAISVYLLGDARTQLGLILLIPCVALTGIENFHKHFFYGSGIVRPPAIVELLEQFVRTFAVITLLLLFLPQYPERVVGLIVGGMVVCEVFSSCTLAVLYRRRRGRLSGPGETGRVRRRASSPSPCPWASTPCWATCWGRPTPPSSPKSWWRPGWTGPPPCPSSGWCAG